MSDPDRPAVNLRAACACGAVNVAVEGRVVSMFMCACEDCQRATGGGHSAVAVFRADAVTITGAVRGHASPSASGATFERSFCPICGTPIHGRSSRAPHLMMLPVGLFSTDTAWYAPNQLIFARSHRDWDFLPDALPRHETYRDGLSL